MDRSELVPCAVCASPLRKESHVRQNSSSLYSSHFRSSDRHAGAAESLWDEAESLRSLRSAPLRRSEGTARTPAPAPAPAPGLTTSRFPTTGTSYSTSSRFVHPAYRDFGGAHSGGTSTIAAGNDTLRSFASLSARREETFGGRGEEHFVRHSSSSSSLRSSTASDHRSQQQNEIREPSHQHIVETAEKRARERMERLHAELALENEIELLGSQLQRASERNHKLQDVIELLNNEKRMLHLQSARLEGADRERNELSATLKVATTQLDRMYSQEAQDKNLISEASRLIENLSASQREDRSAFLRLETMEDELRRTRKENDELRALYGKASNKDNNSRPSEQQQELRDHVESLVRASNSLGREEDAYRANGASPTPAGEENLRFGETASSRSVQESGADLTVSQLAQPSAPPLDKNDLQARSRGNSVHGNNNGDEERAHVEEDVRSRSSLSSVENSRKFHSSVDHQDGTAKRRTTYEPHHRFEDAAVIEEKRHMREGLQPPLTRDAIMRRLQRIEELRRKLKL